MDDFMPVISLWNPWAIWVSLGWKSIETRTHQRFSSLKGKRIGIHASLKWSDDAYKLAAPYLYPDQLAVSRGFLKVGGAIICTAHVRDFRRLTEADSAAALIDCGSVERYGLILSDVRTIEAVPCKGRQGIWYQSVPQHTA